MKTLISLVRSSVVFPVAGLLLAGCPGGGGGTVAELTEEQVAEAMTNQAISAYYETSLSLDTANGDGINIACNKGGTLTWAELDTNGEICYQAQSNGCTVSGTYGSMTLQGGYSICGFPKTISEDGQISDIDGTTLYLDGNITATSDNGTSKTCEYDLDLTQIQITDNAGTVTFSSGISGSFCGDRGFSMETSFTVSNQVEVSDAE